MDDLKVTAKTLLTTKKNLIEEIKSAIRCLSSVEEDLGRVKSEVLHLQKMNKEMES